MKKIILLSFMALLGVTSNAMAVDTGEDQVILFKTSPNVASHCIVRNGSNTIYIPNTPYRSVIPKGVSALDIECTSNDGIYRGTYKHNASFNPKAIVSLPWEALNTATYLASGLGESEDSTFGTMAKYPSTIIVNMVSGAEQIQDAKVVSEDQAILNAPREEAQAVTTETLKPTTEKHHVRKHVKHIRKATSSDIQGKS